MSLAVPKGAYLGANVGATRANDFLRQANGSGRAHGDRPSPRTDPDDAERLTCIYGSVSVSLRRSWVDCRQDRFRRSG
jgi:hypothetical protein